MGVDDDREGLNAYAMGLIKWKAENLVGRAGLTVSDQDDVEQELVMDLLKRLPRFDPRRGGINTFVSRVVKHRVATIIGDQMIAMRDYRKRGPSLNETVENGDEEPMEHVDSIDQEEYMHRMGRVARPLEEAQELAIDVGRLISELPPDLAEICLHLQTKGITDVARDLGVTRSTVRAAIARMRPLFEQAGLEEYL